jgi:hypothetical protein
MDQREYMTFLGLAQEKEKEKKKKRKKKGHTKSIDRFIILRLESSKLGFSCF